MRYSRMFIPTLKETVQENEPLNYRLLNRAGYIRRSAAGVYAFLPLGAKTLAKLQGLIVSKLEDRNCFEIKTAASQDIGDLIRLLGAGRLSYKELPIGAWFLKDNMLQSIRPRLGLLHPRAWQSLQAVKLVQGMEELDGELQYMKEGLEGIIKALGIDALTVERLSEHALDDKDLILFWPYSSGEDSAARCTSCGRLTTPDSISCPPVTDIQTVQGELQIVHTPGVKTIQEVAEFLAIDAKLIVKTLIYKADDRLVGVLIRGDRDLSEVKLKNVLNCSVLTPANAEEVYKATGAEVGFAGPIGLKAEIICDYEAAALKAVVVGANKTDHHYMNASIERDFKVDIIADVRSGEASDACNHCGGSIEMIKGFNLAGLNKIGKSYAEKQGMNFINNAGITDFIHALDIEVNLHRLLAAVVESSNDEAGVCMPKAIAPYDIVVMPVHADNEEQVNAALEIYCLLQEKGFDVLLDDRNDRVSSKFKDSELIGVPLRITVGRKIAEGIVEVKPRRGDMHEIHIHDIMRYIMNNEVDYAVET